MSDVDEQLAATPDGAEPAAPSAGELIRQAREAAGLHIAALAVALKVPVKKLEALESGRFDLLPDAVFVRALASSVCRSLKIDPQPVLERLPQTHVPRLLYQDKGINAPFRAPSDGPGPSVWTQVSRPTILAGMLLLLGALVLIMLPTLSRQLAALKPEAPAAPAEAGRAVESVVLSPADSGVPAASAPVASDLFPPAANAASVVLEAPAPVASAPLAAPAPQPVASAAARPLAAASASLPGRATPTAALPLATASAARPGAAASAALPAVTASAPAGSGIVVFTAKGESWVEVTDARRVVVLRRTLAAGETVGATGALPLTAVVGRADATSVQVRGKAFDLAPLARDNVARFEVK